MLKAISEYVSDFEKELNVKLMNKEADLPLVEYVKDAWLSLEIVKNIKILKFEYTEKESEININKYIFKREKRKRKKDKCDYKFVNDDRYGRLTTYIQITTEEQDPKTKEVFIRQKVIKKPMLIPLQDEDGYYQIKGQRYYLIYQLVEKSTYTSSNSVTLKSLMPVAVKRNSIKTENILSKVNVKTDVIGNEFVLPVYNVFIFRKEIPIVLLYVANGFDYALNYLGVSEVIRFVPNLDDADHSKCLYFEISSKLYIEVNTEMFLKYPYVQSIVGGFLEVCTNRFVMDDLDIKSTWIKKLANNNTIEKGEDILVFLNRLLDETTKKVLKVHDFNKADIYAVLRWIMQNFNELRKKDNMSLENKRLRCNEYIAALLTLEFSFRLNKIISLGSKATMEDFKDMFKFSGEILLQKMHNSGILRFNDNVNDQDFFMKFKYTTKGPHSIFLYNLLIA